MNPSGHSRGLLAPDCGVVLERLRLRGFELDSREEACDVGQWLRFTPMLQALLFGVATITASAEIFLALAGLLAVGVLMGCHPFDLIYTGIIRQLENVPEHPRCSFRRRAVFLVGIALSAATVWSFTNGHAVAGYLLGAAMTASTALLAATHICIPSLVLGWLSRAVRRGA